MTTIAIRGREIAADSGGSRGTIRMPGCDQKLFECPDGSICGVVGDTAQTSKVIRWIQDGEVGDCPTMERSEVVRLYPDGKIRVYSSDSFYDVPPARYRAYGSGFEIALGALYMGASPTKAVLAASQFDSYTFGD